MSMRIDVILENTLRNSKLKRVRVKIDPAQLVMQNYHLLDSYEGYVLEECGSNVRVYMMNLPGEFDPIQTVNKQFVADVKDSSDRIITKVLAQLKKEGIESDNPVYQKIEKSQSGEFIDSYLSELGFDSKQIIEFYKKIALHPVVEGIADVLQKATSGAEKITSSPLFGAAKIGSKALSKLTGLAVGRNNVIGRAAEFIDPRGSGFMNIDSLIKTAEKYQKTSKNALLKGTPIFIGELPSEYLKAAGNRDGITFQISGTIGLHNNEKIPLSLKLENLFPLPVEQKFEVYLDYPDLHNPHKKGMLYLIDRRTGNRESYPVRINDLENRIVARYDKEEATDIDTDDRLRRIEAAREGLKEAQYKVNAQIDSALKRYKMGFRNIEENKWLPRHDKEFSELREKLLPKLEPLGAEGAAGTLEKLLEPLLRNKRIAETSDPDQAMSALNTALGGYK